MAITETIYGLVELDEKLSGVMMMLVILISNEDGKTEYDPFTIYFVYIVLEALVMMIWQYMVTSIDDWHPE